MAEQWGIYRQDHRTGHFVRFNPTVDGRPRVFRTRKAAMDFAYDYGIAGQRNQHVKYRRESTREVNPLRSRKRRGPPRGKVPPQLRRYLFKKGRR